jgi:hypothetical protein
MDRSKLESIADRIAQRQGERSVSEQMQLRRGRIKDEQGPVIFRELEQQLESTIGQLKQELKSRGCNQDLDIRTDAQGVSISSSSDPFIKFHIDRRQDRCGQFNGVYACSAGQKKPNQDESDLSIHLKVRADDTVCLVFENKEYTPSELSDKLITMLFV